MRYMLLLLFAGIAIISASAIRNVPKSTVQDVSVVQYGRRGIRR